MGKLLGLPMGCDACYTNHADADQNDLENLLTAAGHGRRQLLHGRARADDVMLNYQSTSFHDAPTLRQLLGLRPRPSSRRGSSAWACRYRAGAAAAPQHPARPRPPAERAAGAGAVTAGREPWTALRAPHPGAHRAGPHRRSLPTASCCASARARPGARRGARRSMSHALNRDLAGSACDVLEVASAAADRRPTCGGRIWAATWRAAREALAQSPARLDLACVIADGLSATAVHAMRRRLSRLLPRLPRRAGLRRW